MTVTNGSTIHVDIPEKKSEKLTCKTIEKQPSTANKALPGTLLLRWQHPENPALLLTSLDILERFWPSNPQGPGRCCAPPTWWLDLAQAAPNVLLRRLGRSVPSQ